ncbi:heme ABC transporter ATP-binding protein [Rhodobacterales bacterium]|nr:heme ABC transporter ATP-binding protein [Rhodobacterales bacterium]
MIDPFRQPSQGRDTALAVENVTVSIGRVAIVRDVSFHAHAGQVLAIIGPSGSGKTTLMKAISGDIAHDGRIFLNGADLRGLGPEPLADMRGVLPQSSQIAFPLTVAEVIGLGVPGHVATRNARAARISDALEKVGLGGFEGRSWPDLSGGEQQRVQLARVLCQVWEPVPEGASPRWLFLDEPVSSLDIKHQYQIMALAADYAARGGGVVAVMHDLNLTAAFADTVLVMKQGRRLAFGAGEEIFRPELLSRAYDFPLRLVPGAAGDRPVIVPSAGASFS